MLQSALRAIRHIRTHAIACTGWGGVLCNRRHNQHVATTISTQSAQSTETWKWAPHDDRDPTRAMFGGFLERYRTGAQWERSQAQKVQRGLRKTYQHEDRAAMMKCAQIFSAERIGWPRKMKVVKCHGQIFDNIDTFLIGVLCKYSACCENSAWNDHHAPNLETTATSQNEP